VQDEEVLQFAGEVDVEEVFITSSLNPSNVDLTNFMVEFNLYEDLFSPTMHGDIVISDSNNLITELPMIGTELITVKFRTPTLLDVPENIIEKTFQVYSITNRTLNNDRSQFYALNFMSVEAYSDNAVALSKTFDGNTADLVSKHFEMIQGKRRVDQNRKTGLVIHDTPHASQIRYTSCYWSPIKNIMFIGRRVKGAQIGMGDFIFFETNKAFYFTSLESLIADQRTVGVFDEYVYELQPDSIPRFNPDKYGNTFPSSMTRIEEMTVPKVIDVLDGQDSGYYGQVNRGYDMFTKKMSENIFDARQQLGNFVRTENGVPIPSDILLDPQTQTQFVSYNSGLYNTYGLDAETHDPKIMFRKSYLNSFNQFKFEITIPGRTDIEVGQLISILYPAAKTKLGDETEMDDVFDPLLTGQYIVSALHHTITTERHVIRAEVIKNGLTKSLGEVK